MKPILFNADMVRAILDGRKTVTRRVVKPQPKAVYHDGKVYDDDGLYVVVENQNGRVEQIELPYHTGDILYVRETWAAWSRTMGTPPALYYKADGNAPDGIKWHPSIHMPREAARIFLRVKDVRVERLQDITVEGVLREVVPDIEPPPICRKEPSYPESFPKGFDKWNTEKQDDWIQSEARARYIGWCEYADKLLGHFKTVWDSTIKPAYLSLYGWEANPWVWVVAFERISKPE